jgi:hypothetical protein
MDFPKEIFVRVDGESGEEFLLAEPELADAIEGDGPTLIASYKLVEIMTAEKVTNCSSSAVVAKVHKK